jgi:BirA family biotin operon repressor/biotin-[acetyl-CoA-carboxylase] ligase
VCFHDIERLPFIQQVIHLPSVDSTNLYARRLSFGSRHGCILIVADRQTAGRGQRGSCFFSAARGGIWASLVVPIRDLSHHFHLNRAMSLAILETLTDAAPGLSTSIKWPNDIYAKNKKICGILLETFPAPQHGIIIGFGVNINLEENDFPPPLQSIATSLFQETGKTYETAQLLYGILMRFRHFRALSSAAAHRIYLDRLYRRGHAAKAGEVEGIFDTVDEDGRVCLVQGDRRTPVSSGPLTFIDTVP